MDEPPQKMQKSDSVFQKWIDEFKATEKTDAEVNDALPTIVNNAFRDGLTVEKNRGNVERNSQT